MQNIQYQIFERIYQRCKYLLVPEFIENPQEITDTTPLTSNDKLIAPRQFESLSGRQRNDAFKAWEKQVERYLPHDYNNRHIVYLKPGNDDLPELKNNGRLPALFLSNSSDFVEGEEASRSEHTTTLGTRPKRMVVAIQLAITEKDPTELYGQDGVDIKLEKSRPGRILQIQGQLRQILDPADFLNITVTSPNYTQRSEVIASDLSTERVLISDHEDTVMQFRYEIIYKEQVMRDEIGDTFTVMARGTTIDVNWPSIPEVSSYQVRVDQVDQNDKVVVSGVWIDTVSVSHVFTELKPDTPLQSGERYRVSVRATGAVLTKSITTRSA